MDINVTAYINQLGYGIAGLNIVKAFVRAGHTPALWVNGHGEAPQEDVAVIQQAMARTETYNRKTTSLRISYPYDMAHRVGLGRHTGLPFFELNRLTLAEKHHLSGLDAIFVPSRWATQVLQDNGLDTTRVFLAPLGVDRDIFHPDVEPAIPGTDGSMARTLRQKNTTVFLNVGKWEFRKGHDILCKAFCRAFTPRDNVALIMNCFNPLLTETEQEEWVKLYHGASTGQSILLMPFRLPRQQDLAQLMSVADCGVFPARAEGWNLDLAEMMAMGKTVIATNYSGHTEFCTSENCMLLEVDGLETAYDGKFFVTRYGEWAKLGERQVDQLVESMRFVHKAKQGGSLRRNQDGIETFRRFTWDNTVREMLF